MRMTNLLLEIGTEEIPAFYLEPALRQMEAGLKKELAENRIKAGSIFAHGSPRRLMLYAGAVLENQEDEKKEVLGPAETIAFDPQGKPTQAALGFVKGQGMDLKDIRIKKTPRGKYISVVRFLPGKQTLSLLPGMLTRIISSLSFPKSMRWRDRALTFARPIRYIMALFGREVISLEIGGVRSGRTVQGHPFLSPLSVEIPEADFESYKTLLKKHFVVVDYGERRQLLLDKVSQAAGKERPATDEALTTEVSNLIQYPNAARGRFHERFLKLPPEVLEAVLKKHQRYFPLYGKDGSLLPRFVVVYDRKERDAREIVEGNERVLQARLSDAEFYFQEDLKRSLGDRIEDLKGVLYLEGLGSLREKVDRLRNLCSLLCGKLGYSPEETKWAEEAALLSKSDLTAGMVGEFPELQGIVGFRYALAEGKPREVAWAIREQYLPRSPQDPLPQERTGSVLALAEKLDSIAGCFLLGKEPSGSQDPYALRRQAYGILRILGEWKFPLLLSELIDLAVRGYDERLRKEGIEERIFQFLRERMIQMFLDEGYSHDLVDAVMASGVAPLSAMRKKFAGLSALQSLPVWESLVASVERTSNILKKGCPRVEVAPRLFQQEEEKELYRILQEQGPLIRRIMEEERFVDASIAFEKAFGAPLHRFFNNVFVNVEDPAVRENRLALLRDINRIYTSRLADLSKVVIPGA